MSDISLLRSIVGKTIESVATTESFESNYVASVTIKFTDGTSIDIESSSYNYGGQFLIVSES